MKKCTEINSASGGFLIHTTLAFATVFKALNFLCKIPFCLKFLGYFLSSTLSPNTVCALVLGWKLDIKETCKQETNINKEEGTAPEVTGATD